MLSHALSLPPSKSKQIMTRAILKWATIGITFVMALYLILALYAQRQFVFALLFLVVIGSALYIFASKRTYAHRYIYPSLAGMAVFVIFPLLYTVGVGFTNYSASNLLTQPRVLEHLLSERYQTDQGRYDFKLYSNPDGYVLYLQDAAGHWLQSAPLQVAPTNGKHKPQAQSLGLQPVPALPAEGEALGLRDIVKLKDDLKALTLVTPDHTDLTLSGLRNFAAMRPLFSLNSDGSLVNNQTGQTLTANNERGFYQYADGKTISPGWTVTIGWGNYVRVLTDPSIRGPFTQIFTWTVVFATLTVVFTLSLGLLLASLLQWDQIRGKSFYRMMLILPYAVPAFISILVFKGLFNQNFGEINLVLQHLFGVRPDWFSDPFMAKAMILIVNTWLGYPYMMLLCMGLLQAIPRDLYEASAMDGAGPISNLFRITLPLILKPLIPLLIASFAFNFNNFVLIALLTNGAPDIIGASTPAGTTDLLVSYTYRIAFQDSGQNFGLAAAIATVIFVLVGSLSLLNLKLSKVKV